MDAMTDTRETLARYAAAWLSGDTKTIVGLYAEDIVFEYLGQHGLAGRHEGKTRALTALAEFNRRTGRKLVSIVDIMAGPNLGAVVAREALGPEATETTRVLVYTVGDGLLRSCTIYDEDPALIDRLVGDEPLATAG